MELEKAKAPMEVEGATAGGLSTETGIDADIPFHAEKAAAVSPGRCYLAVKRCFDFLSSLVVSIILLPLMLILMALIMIKDPGNPLYFQKRVGKNGKMIRVAKLRTMKKNSDHLEDMLTPEQLEEYRHEYKLKDDPRLIGWKKPGDGRKCFGAILRRFSLDELPQIFYNICLKGNMSVVGPRPILQDELKKNYLPEEQREILSMKPGLTGYWQAYARNDATYESGERQRMELHYVRHCSIRLDTQILFHTIGTVLSTRGGVLKNAVRQAFGQYIASCQLLYAVADPELVAARPVKDSDEFLDHTEVLRGKRLYWIGRRTQDILFSSLAILVLWPLVAICAILIVIDSPGASPFFVQERVGRDGKVFRFVKLRSMKPNAEAELDNLLDKNEMDGPVFKIKDDPRITRVGKFIRKCSIDELPQLWNILKGDMSIVGPRPPVPREVEQYTEYQRQRLYVTPGLTCYWQIQPHRNDLSFDEWVELDLKYIRERGFLTDWKIIFKTFGAVFHLMGE